MARLNELSPVKGSRAVAKRVGRGIGSGLGKTGGRGHKGQKSRSGGFHKMGFEGGQMPIQRRLPKFGFTARVNNLFAEVRLGELNKVKGEEVSLLTLKTARIVRNDTQKAKIILSGTLDKKLTVKGISVTKGAKLAIEKAGGTIEE